MMIQRICKVIDSLVSVLLVIIFSIMVINVLWQIASRFLLGDPSSFTEELARFSLIWLTVLGAAFVVGSHGHISMDYFYQKASPTGRRRMMLVVYGAVIAFALVVMVIGGSQLVYTTLYLGQKSAALQVPLGYVYTIVPISGLLMTLYTIRNASLK